MTLTAFNGMRGGLTDVEGISVGHFTHAECPTGCTIVLCERGAVAGVDVRGGAPGTRETTLLDPVNTVQKVHGIALSGGSAYGLEVAGGVMRYLEERSIGFRIGPSVVPVVPAAILFDLQLGDGKVRPTAESGYRACLAASSGKVAEGNVGAGAGCTVGKLLGPRFAMKSGLGTASIRAGDSGLIVAALVAVNALGDVFDPVGGKILAGARSPDGKGFADSMQLILAGKIQSNFPVGESTTIGVVATNAALTKSESAKVAQMAHDGLARTINPVHTDLDGDAIFALATGTLKTKATTTTVGAIAAVVTAQAVLRAVTAAEGLPGLPSRSDFQRG